jgi:hypothetical protein
MLKKPKVTTYNSIEKMCNVLRETRNNIETIVLREENKFKEYKERTRSQEVSEKNINNFIQSLSIVHSLKTKLAGLNKTIEKYEFVLLEMEIDASKNPDISLSEVFEKIEKSILGDL